MPDIVKMNDVISLLSCNETSSYDAIVRFCNKDDWLLTSFLLQFFVQNAESELSSNFQKISVMI